MPVELSHIAAFVTGLISTFHCWGMCGGIIGALGMNIPSAYKEQRYKQVLITLAYNLGRIGSYSIAGMLTATAGFIFSSAAGHGGHLVLRTLSGVVLVYLGLRIAGWLPALPILGIAGNRLWKVIQPLGKPFLPIDNFAKALIVGAIWGWLPCGLVYSVLLWSATTANPVYGATYMLSFGLGTLPGMLLAGMFIPNLLRMKGIAFLRVITGGILISFGLVSLSMPYWHHH